MCVCVCGVYTLFSSSLGSSGAESAAAVGRQKLLSQTGTLVQNAASPVCTASGGGGRDDSWPAGRGIEKRSVDDECASKLNHVCQVEIMEWHEIMKCPEGFEKSLAVNHVFR